MPAFFLLGPWQAKQVVSNSGRASLNNEPLSAACAVRATTARIAVVAQDPPLIASIARIAIVDQDPPLISSSLARLAGDSIVYPMPDRGLGRNTALTIKRLTWSLVTTSDTQGKGSKH